MPWRHSGTEALRPAFRTCGCATTAVAASAASSRLPRSGPHLPGRQGGAAAAGRHRARRLRRRGARHRLAGRPSHPLSVQRYPHPHRAAGPRPELLGLPVSPAAVRLPGIPAQRPDGRGPDPGVSEDRRMRGLSTLPLKPIRVSSSHPDWGRSAKWCSSASTMSWSTPRAYSIAHTDLAIESHNDLVSYTWPPSVQVLHMLANECEGGDSSIVDGFAVLDQLRRERPGMFDLLCSVPVPFRLFSDHEETSSVNPMVELDGDGNLRIIRFNNQIMQAVPPLPATGRRLLCRLPRAVDAHQRGPRAGFLPAGGRADSVAPPGTACCTVARRCARTAGATCRTPTSSTTTCATT